MRQWRKRFSIPYKGAALDGALLVGSIYLLGRLAEELVKRFRRGDPDADRSSFDGRLMKELREEQLPPGVGSVLELLGKATSTRTLGPAAALGAIALAPRRRRAALFLLAATISTLTSQRLLKAALARPRPEEQRREHNSASFPSGHSALTTSLALAATILCKREFPHYQPPVAAVALPLAVLVGASRPLIRQHYPSDVIAGDALGVACVLAANLWYSREPSKHRGL
jgi:hypothetical protein